MDFFRVKTGYGIDAGGGHVAIDKTSRLRGRFEHTTVYDGPVAEASPKLVSWLNQIASDITAGDAVTAAGIPVHESIIRWIRTPLKSKSKAARTLPSLLDIQLPFPLEACEYRLAAFSRTPQGQMDALAVAVPHSALSARLDTLRGWGFDAMALDHEGLALWTQSLVEIPPERDALRVVAYLGHDRTVLVVGRGGELAAAHSLRQGLDDFSGAAEEAAREPLRRAFSARLAQMLKAHAPEASGGAAPWLWTGPGATREAYTQFIQGAMGGLAAEFRLAAHRHPAGFLARAYGERSLSPGPLRCNFRQGALAHALVVKRGSRRGLHSAIAALAAGLVLCALNLGWSGLLHRRANEAQAELTSLARRLAPGAPAIKGQEVLMVKRTLEQQEKLIQPFWSAFKPSPAQDLMRILAPAVKNGLTLESAALKPDSILLRGTAGDWTRCEAVAAQFRADGCEIAVNRQEAGADERVHFEIKGGCAHDQD